MSMYTPQIKEEVSENAKMLVIEEDDGKVYKASMPNTNIKFVSIYVENDITKADITYDELKKLLYKRNAPIIVACIVVDTDFDYYQYQLYSNTIFINKSTNEISISFPDGYRCSFMPDGSVSFYSVD